MNNDTLDEHIIIPTGSAIAFQIGDKTVDSGQTVLL